MKTRLLTIAMTAALMLTAMTKVQAQDFDGPCLPPSHGLNDHQSAFCSISQTIALMTGTNWVSFYVDVTLDDLKSALVAALPSGNSTSIVIASQTQQVKYQRGRWAGQLSALELTQMYRISVSADCEIALEGMRVDPSGLTITIAPGTNFIAFPFSTSMTVTDFFAGFAVNNDQVKSQTQSAKYQRGRWGGQLTTLVPGQGYKYVSADTSDRLFSFPALSK